MVSSLLSYFRSEVKIQNDETLDSVDDSNPTDQKYDNNDDTILAGSQISINHNTKDTDSPNASEKEKSRSEEKLYDCLQKILYVVPEEENLSNPPFDMTNSSSESSQLKAFSDCSSVYSAGPYFLDRSSDSEGYFKRKYFGRRRVSQFNRRATVAEFDRKPWNYGAWGLRYRRDSVGSRASSVIEGYSKLDRYFTRKLSERGTHSNIPRRKTTTGFERKPWNYGVWSLKDSRSSSSMEIYSSREDNIRRKLSDKETDPITRRRATVTGSDHRKPWNYGAGGTEYQKLLYPFGKRKSII